MALGGNILFEILSKDVKDLFFIDLTRRKYINAEKDVVFIKIEISFLGSFDGLFALIIYTVG